MHRRESIYKHGSECTCAGCAENRERKLLLSHLSDKQKSQFLKKRWFEVVGEASDQIYRVKCDFGGVDLIGDRNKVLINYCIHTSAQIWRQQYGWNNYERVPDADNMLAVKLALETDEREFLATANADAHSYASTRYDYYSHDYFWIGVNPYDPLYHEDNLLDYFPWLAFLDEDDD